MTHMQVDNLDNYGGILGKLKKQFEEIPRLSGPPVDHLEGYSVGVVLFFIGFGPPLTL